MDGERGQEPPGRHRAWSAAAALALATTLITAGPVRAQPTTAWLYSARPGDTIWDLSRMYLTDWRRWPELQAINRIEDPKRIPPGRIISFPVAWLRTVPAVATPTAVEPPTQVRDADQLVWQPLTVGRALSDGAAVATGPDGSVTLQFADDSSMLIPGGTTIVLERLRRFDGTPLADSVLRLEQGRVVPADVPSGSRLSVRSPPATTSVRGTTFRLALDEGAAKLDTEVLRGSVTVAAQGRRVLVGTGFGATTRAWERPRAVVPLLPPPDVGRAPERVEKVPFTIELRPLAGAVGYHLELSRDAQFSTLLVDAIADRQVIRVPNLPDGIYTWRVRGIDARGLEGRNATHAIEVDARPEPPAPLLPRRTDRVRDPRPRFAWAEPVEAAGYHFRLVQAGAPTRPVLDRDDLRSAEFVPSEALPVGEYAWQVATRAPDGEIGPFSDPQPFARLEPLPVPEPEVGAATSDELVVRLPNASEGARYQVQLARDARFTDIAVDRLLDDPELQVKHLYPDRYYLRARVIEADGYEGAFSPPQRIDVVPTQWWPMILIPLAMILLAL